MFDSLHALDWLYLTTAVVLILLSGLYAAAEIGILALSHFRLHQLAEAGSVQARLLQRLLQQPVSMLTAVLILITVLHYINESLVTYWLHGLHGLPEWVPYISLLLLLLIFGEVTPISYAAANPEIVATRAARLLALTSRLLRPLVWLTTGLANLLLRLAGGKPLQPPLVTGEEVRTIVDIETERGVLEEEEKELIHSIFEFSDTVVREIMVPRIDMVAVSETMTIAEAIDVIIAHHFSRLPVYQGNMDHIRGLVHAKDLLPYQFSRQTGAPVREAMRSLPFVPETKRVSELLREFRETKQTLAVVLDEYGGTAGLVTIEDLLEEIVGEIYDEYDPVHSSFEWIDDYTVIVDGKLPVDEVSEIIDFAIPRGDYDTIAGFLYSRFGDVPTRGESTIVAGHTFFVERLDGHRITLVRIVRPTPRTGGAPA